MAAIQSRLVAFFGFGAAVLIGTSSGALAHKKYDPGANDTEIQIRQHHAL